MTARRMVALLIAFLILPASAAERIERIEPASWWTGMRDGRLQLMVHGEGVAELEPAIRYPGVTLAGVERTANPNYLFMNLLIAPETSPGTLVIDFRRGDAVIERRDYLLAARSPGSAERRGFGPQDVIYLVMPDRYANGDTTNDKVKGLEDRLARDEPLARHGGDLQGIIDHLDYVSDMGFTQLWLNPVLENAQPEHSYHGYAITDFYRVDPRLGTNETYLELSAEARGRGIGLIMDVVLNHCGSGHWWLQDLPAPDWLNGTGQFQGTHHVREALQDPHAAQVDRESFSDGWFVETMPDLNQRNPLLATYLIQNTIWWIEYAGLSGLRVDTYSYSDRDFLTEWSRRVMQEYPELNVVGEEWSGNPIIVSYWQRGRNPSDGYQSYLPAVFDFPLQEAVGQALLEKEDWGTGMRRIYRVLANDSIYADPDDLVVFADNHDVSRIHTVLGERDDLTRMAVAFFLTTRGIPQVFYGTEILMSNPGPKNDGVIRSDFPGGWPGDRRNAFTGEGLSKSERDMQDYVRRLLQWRKSAPVLHDGKLTHFVPQEGVYVYFRHDASQRIMVVLNNTDASRSVETKRFREILGDSRTGVDVLSGASVSLEGSLAAPAHSATILEVR